MHYMYDSISDISQISDLEITCLIYAALLHDIGMVANETEIEAIKKDELTYCGRKYSVIFNKYQSENSALQEFIRPVHGERSFRHIMQMKKNLFVVSEFTKCNFQEELAKICQAHTMNRDWILHNLDSYQIKGEDEFNAQYVAMLLRIADSLDIDEKRAPIELYRLINPIGFGDEEWRQHYIIENRDKVRKNNKSGSSTIMIYGQCDEPKIHRKFLQYLSGISEELLWCTSYARKYFEEKYWVLIQPQIDNRIQTKGFEISDLKMQINYHALIKLLMGENIYGDKKCGLRELVQNAIDACKVMIEEAERVERYRYAPYIPKIQVILDYKMEKVIVMDNGIGMTNDVMINYFLNIGKSYYKSDEFLYQGKQYCPIGTFGIGFLACFMLSDSVTVETKHFTEQDGFTIQIERDSEFICKKNQVRLLGGFGTAVMLDMESTLEVFDQEPKNIRKYIEENFLNQGIKIQFITIDDVRKSETIKLIELEKRNPYGTKLDSYLNGISALADLIFDKIKVSKKFSDLCIKEDWEKGERVFAEYDFAKNEIYLRDIKGDELRKYIEKNCLLVIKVQSIKEEEKKSYEEWKKWNGNKYDMPANMLRIIYFPIEYSKSLLKYCERNQRVSTRCGAIWQEIKLEFVKDALPYLDVKKLLLDCKMLFDCLQIEIGVFSIINVGRHCYLEIKDSISWWRSSYDAKGETYWHGIRLDKGEIIPNIKIVGVICNTCDINILNKEISPNVARNELPDDVKEKIRLAVERAVYQYIINNLVDDRELQIALQDYVNKNYTEDNPYYLAE